MLGLGEMHLFFATLIFILMIPCTAKGRSHSVVPRLQMPVSRAKLKDGFGRLQGKINEGISLLTPARSQVVASARGRILLAGPIPEYQNSIIIDHGRFFTVYAGMGMISVKKGDWVESLAPIGATGGGEFHFEVRLESGDTIDPLEVLKFSIAGRGKKLDEGTVTEILTSAGFPMHVVPVFSCIAYYESGWRSEAINMNTNRTADAGLLQINDVNHKACGIRDRNELFNPHTNAKCAYIVWKKQGLNAWVAYQKKKAICDKYRL